MVINYQAYPILRLADNNAYKNAFRIPTEDAAHILKNYSKEDKEFLARMVKSLNNGLFREEYSRNVVIYSTKFMEAVEKTASSGAFSKLDQRGVLEENLKSGIFTYHMKGVGNHTTVVIRKDDRADFLCFAGENLIAVFGIHLKTMQGDVCFKSVKLEGGNEQLTYIVQNMNAILMFEKYASVEIETSKCGKTMKSSILSEKVKNVTPFNVKIMDSRWFVKICRDEDYEVRGHFRLQACGEGHKERKMIYINPFVKHGYHRNARIENEKV